MFHLFYLIPNFVQQRKGEVEKKLPKTMACKHKYKTVYRWCTNIKKRLRVDKRNQEWKCADTKVLTNIWELYGNAPKDQFCFFKLYTSPGQLWQHDQFFPFGIPSKILSHTYFVKTNITTLNLHSKTVLYNTGYLSYSSFSFVCDFLKRPNTILRESSTGMLTGRNSGT